MRNKDKDSYRKFLLVIKIIQEFSDENHQLTSQDIDEYLKMYDYQFQISTKMIKKYIDEYNEIFPDHIIVNKCGRTNYYYFTGTNLDVMEAKAIVDLVYSSDFFTSITKNNYKKRIKDMFSRHYHSYFDKRIVLDIEKNANDKVFYKELEVINEAIVLNKLISFTYSKPVLLNENKKEVTIAPIDTYFFNNTYYLICQGNKNKDDYITYRLDYISNVSIIMDSFVTVTPYHIERYKNKLQQMTYMYQEGQSDFIELEFDESVYSNIIDKFGKSIRIYNGENNRFRTLIKTIVNSTFYSWVIGFNGKITISGNSEQVQNFYQYLKSFIKE